MWYRSIELGRRSSRLVLLALLTLLASTATVSDSGGGGSSGSSFSKGEAQTILGKLTPEQLVQALRRVGYKYAKLPPRMEEASRTVGHGCHGVHLVTETAAPGKNFKSNPLYASSDDGRGPLDLTSMLETQEQAAASIATTMTTTTVQARAKASADANPVKDLDCECEPYECSCHKQCFCRLTGDPFTGTHYPPDANCPVCAKCPVSGSDEGADGDDEAATTQKQNYKCSCSFEGIGGPGISDGGYMECDCKVADCSCSKKCACKLKKKADSSVSFREALPPVLAPQEGVPTVMSTREVESSMDTSTTTATNEVNAAGNRRRTTTTPLRANSIVRPT